MIYNFFNKLNESKKFPYFLCTPLPYAIGTAADDLRVAVKKASILKKKLLIITPTILQNLFKYKICNKYFYKDLRINELSNFDRFMKYIFIILINLQFLLNRIAFFFIKNFTKVDITGKQKEFLRFANVGVRFKYGMKKKINFDEILLPQHDTCKINLSEEANSFCIKKMEEIGINEKDNFVCVHVRDNKYRKDEGRREFRNSDINNYKKAILYLLDKNYWVVRLGQSSNKKLEINHPKFIDYPFSKFRNHCLDLYLVKNCKFMISTQSGLLSLGLLFDKPILLTNAIRLFETKSSNQLSRVISKKPFWKKDKKLITLENYLSLKYSHHHIDFVNSDIDFEQNSSIEILEATKEFLENLERTIDFIPEENQVIFNRFILASFKNHYDSISFKSGINSVYLEQVFNLAAQLKETKEYYCSFFLKKYFQLNSKK